MTNYKGNPDFGTKYRSEPKTGEAFSEQVGTRVPPKTKTQLKQLADKKNCSVPDLVRAAIERYIAEVSSEIDGEVENAA